MIDKFVKNILDVPGVEGVCVFDREGQAIDNQLPSYFVEELFEDLSRRVLSLYETVDENFIPCDDYLLKYSERWLFLRRGNGIFILVFAQATVNRVSLKMVTNIALKNIKSATKTLPIPAARTTTTPAVPAPTRTPTPAPRAATPAAPQAAPAPAPAAESTSETEEDPSRKRVARPRPTRSFRGSSY